MVNCARCQGLKLFVHKVTAHSLFSKKNSPMFNRRTFKHLRLLLISDGAVQTADNHILLGRVGRRNDFAASIAVLLQIIFQSR